MEILLTEHGNLSDGQAMLVVSIAKASSRCSASPPTSPSRRSSRTRRPTQDRLALARCLFAVAASDERISTAEEAELHRITNQLRIERPDLTAIRLQHKRFLPGMKG